MNLLPNFPLDGELVEVLHEDGAERVIATWEHVQELRKLADNVQQPLQMVLDELATDAGVVRGTYRTLYVRRE